MANKIGSMDTSDGDDNFVSELMTNEYHDDDNDSRDSCLAMQIWMVHKQCTNQPANGTRHKLSELKMDFDVGIIGLALPMFTYCTSI